MSLISLDDALAELKGADSFLLTSHTSPDGDAVGSVLALRHLLEDLGKSNITTALQDPVPAKYAWLPNAKDIVNEKELADSYDLVVIIDVAQMGRIGSIGDRLPKESRILVLDHHREKEPCGDVNYMEPTLASAAEIVVDLYRLAGIAISKEAAACAYVGLSTDTGGFRYGNTDSRAHIHAEELVATGIDVAEISAKVFNDLTRAKLALTAVILERLVIGDNGSYAFTYLMRSDLDEHNATEEDTDGLINYARDIEGVEVGMLFKELTDGGTKVSMRSKSTFDSSACLNGFGGGGHAGASGATMDRPLQDAMDAVVDAVRETLANR